MLQMTLKCSSNADNFFAVFKKKSDFLAFAIDNSHLNLPIRIYDCKFGFKIVNLDL